ncbi:MAG: glycosyltransferase family 4 protein [Verrucomicrobia bacterium]|nr:glycosyltransferase family 4 protein [Verrucomicrobiota bacterium]MBV8485319.1 glycosyltransferase family 4 protein [Verrucomicrobiota bacterium]
MRILYLTPYWPHRVTSASEVRALNVVRALRERGEVEIVVVGGEGAEEEWMAVAEKEFRVACSFPIATYAPRRFYEKLAETLDPRRHYPDCYGVDQKALQRIQKIAQEFDVVWFCKLRTADNFPAWAWPRSVVDIDDLPTMYERSVFRMEVGIRKRLASARRLLHLFHRERLISERFSVLVVCSEADKRYLQKRKIRTPLHVVPNGYTPPAELPVRRPVQPPRIGFIGIFDYAPNLDGISWFARECWPRVKKEIPDARLRLVGRRSDSSLKPPGVDIDGLGWVADAAAEISTWSAMIVPIQRGAGTRGKIAHGLSLKCPIVSTTLGAHGYEFTNSYDGFLADSPADFANACIRTIRNPEEAAAMADRAWLRFLENWTWDAIKPRIWDAVDDCLRFSECRAEQRVNRPVLTR